MVVGCSISAKICWPVISFIFISKAKYCYAHHKLLHHSFNNFEFPYETTIISILCTLFVTMFAKSGFSHKNFYSIVFKKGTNLNLAGVLLLKSYLKF